MKSKDELLEYWKNPPKKNQPDKYLLPERYIYSKFLVSVAERVLPQKDISILELGCNTGRNLKCFWDAGYKNLSAIEISHNAIVNMQKTFPEMQVDVQEGAIEDNIAHLPVFDLVFSVAVLQHIHPDSDWVFPIIASKAKCLITFENEELNNGRHTPRHYDEVFGKYFKENILLADTIPGMPSSYIARIFIK